MMDADQENMLREIFSDSHVIDIDFSLWDKSIAICVIADHVNSTNDGELPAFVVEFVRVRHFACDFKHVGVAIGFGYDQDSKHVQWRIDSISITTVERRIAVTLSQDGIFPVLDLICERIAIRQIAHSLLNALFPDWNRPYSGLARPGIEEMGRLRFRGSEKTPGEAG